MPEYAPHLKWLDRQSDDMIRLVTEWAQINSHSYHLAGLDRMRRRLLSAVEPLQGAVRVIDLPAHQRIRTQGNLETVPLGKMITARKRPEARLQVLLGIHMDTVYSEEHPFQKVESISNGHLRGPGVTDAKGGLVIMLKALEAFEAFPEKSEVGWELFINPDEEIGSPGSGPWLAEHAPNHDLGLMFEPAVERGKLVSERRGSGNLTLVVRGRAAHAGRDPDKGRNAIIALSEILTELNQLNDLKLGVTVNAGQICGGNAPNIVPDLAVAHVNVRTLTIPQQDETLRRIQEIVAPSRPRDSIRVTLPHSAFKPPKVLDPPTEQLLDYLADCGRLQGLQLSWTRSSGASDGNTLAAAGLTTVDSLGARGGGIHSPDEFLETDSLCERAQLVALLLMRLATGDLTWPQSK
jgi:glutamate carboxypeptidase